MTTFVLVHGAWHGEWCWDRLTPRLTAAGHRVVAPTLTGLGSRARELTPAVGLSQHVADVETALRTLKEPAILVGHSYAGIVIREAADRAPETVARIVLLDAWMAPDGCGLFDVAPDWFRSAMLALAHSRGDGWRIPAPSPETVGITSESDIAYVQGLLTDHPLTSFTEPTRLTGAVEKVATSAITVSPSPMPFQRWAVEAGFPVATVEAGHDLMITHPNALADLLLRQTPVSWLDDA